MNGFFAHRFVNMMRRNQNSFGDYMSTQREVIENYDRLVACPDYGMIYLFA